LDWIISQIITVYCFFLKCSYPAERSDRDFTLPRCSGENAIFPDRYWVIIALYRLADGGERAQSDLSFYPGFVYYFGIKGFFRAAISAF
jgi:hypothetical protein